MNNIIQKCCTTSSSLLSDFPKASSIFSKMSAILLSFNIILFLVLFVFLSVLFYIVFLILQVLVNVFVLNLKVTNISILSIILP